MQESYYVGLDVHKRKISYCLMEADGRVVEEGELAAELLSIGVEKHQAAFSSGTWLTGTPLTYLAPW